MPPPNPPDANHLDSAAISGIVIGTIAGIAVLVAFIYYLYKCFLFRRSVLRGRAERRAAVTAHLKSQELEREQRERDMEPRIERIDAHYVPREVEGTEISELSPVCTMKRTSELESPTSHRSGGRISAEKRVSKLRIDESGPPYELGSPVETRAESEKATEWKAMMQKH